MSKHSLVVQWSEEDQAFIAIVPELEGLSAFGETVEEAVRELGVAKKLYLETLEEDGEQIPEPDVVRPFSGQIRLRLPKTLHAQLSREAQKEGISLNTHIVQLLSQRNMLELVLKEIKELKEQRNYEYASRRRGVTASTTQVYPYSYIPSTSWNTTAETEEENKLTHKVPFESLINFALSPRKPEL